MKRPFSTTFLLAMLALLGACSSSVDDYEVRQFVDWLQRELASG